MSLEEIKGVYDRYSRHNKNNVRDGATRIDSIHTREEDLGKDKKKNDEMRNMWKNSL